MASNRIVLSDFLFVLFVQNHYRAVLQQASRCSIYPPTIMAATMTMATLILTQKQISVWNPFDNEENLNKPHKKLNFNLTSYICRI